MLGSCIRKVAPVCSGLLFACLVLAGWFFYQVAVVPVNIPDATHMKIIVAEGDGVHKIADKLKDSRMIRCPRLMTLLYRVRYRDKPLLTGSYIMNHQDTVWQLVQRLGERARLRGRFTLVEGWRWSQLMAALRAETRILHHNEAAIKTAFCSTHYAKSHCLDGMFLAGTYYFYEGSDDISILKTAKHALDETLSQAWTQREPGLWYRTPTQALILASLLQKETAIENEYATIAGVILTRLASGMRLQIDAAVLFGLNRLSGRVTLNDLKRKTEYNNYIHYGLPPTPIAYVNERTIYAALHPQQVPEYMYYVATGRGGHAFSKNHREHLQMKRHYQKHLKSKKVKK